MAKQAGVVRQTLSAAAVVVSLVFVGLEIRQNTAAQRGQTRQALADASRELTVALATDPGLNRAYQALFGLEEGEAAELTPSDRSRAYTMMWASIRNLENVFMQASEGVVDENVMQTYSFTSPGFQSPSFRQYWASVRTRFDSSFVRAFEQANGLE